MRLPLLPVRLPPGLLSDPLDLSAGAGARLLLAAAVLGLLWAAVLWAMA